MPAVDKNNSNLVTTNVNLSTNLLIDALIGGSKWGGGSGAGATIYYSFPTSSNPLYWSADYYNITDAFSETYSGFKALNLTQQTAASSALQSWANVANINFVKVAETASAVGDIRFAFTSNANLMGANTYAYAYAPTQNVPFGGDIWLNPTPPALGFNYSQGASGYTTLVHEIGHALGLRHSFANPNVPNDTSLPADKEYFKYSVMSYSDTATTFDDGYAGYYPTGPMLLDIQAIQYLYGANMSYRTGNDTYVFNGSTTYYQTIWDAGGIDTIQYNSTLGGVIHLTAGEFSQLGRPILVGGGTLVSYENVGIAYNVVIENAIGGSGDDQIYGNEYNNVLDGGQGHDDLIGGAGDDTYVVDLVNFTATQVYINDSIHEYANQGNDTLSLRGIFVNTVNASLSLDYFYPSELENINASATGLTKLDLLGNNLNNILTGNSANNLINGGIGADTLIGGAGNDTYIIDDAGDIITELLNSDIDTVQASITYSLMDTDAAGANGGNIENLTLTGVGSNNATGNAFNNILIGNAASNVLFGGAGADTLDGGAGADSMMGGDGNDTYIVDNGNDTVTEYNTFTATNGIDLVKSSTSYALGVGSYIENLTLTNDIIATGGNTVDGQGNELANTITGNDGDNILSGNAGNDILIGNAGNDVLIGGLGIDSLTGGAGNDIYYIDLVRTSALATSLIALQDAVTELAGAAAGVDTIVLTNELGNAVMSGPIDTSNITSTTTLTLNANLENLDASRTGIIKLNFTGNALSNSILGNDANNVLDGGLSADALSGGAGDDTYLIDLTTAGAGAQASASLQDSLTENVNEGTDTLRLRGAATLINASTLTLGDNIENLDASQTGATKLNLAGNALDNILTGNAVANIIDAGAGNDSLNGGAGNDSLIGGLGDDSLTGGLGNDTLDGGDGNDIYVIDSALDTIATDTNGFDIVKSSITYSIATRNDLESITLTGLAAINAVGNANSNALIGNDAANVLDGSAGADAMNGGKGNDTYIVDNAGDTVTEGFTLVQGGGADMVKSSVSFALGANVDNLTLLTASALDLALNNINATGNELNNIIIGNIGNNQLDGSAGIDNMAGGDGNDIYIVDNIGDITTEANALAAGGVDTVYSSVTRILGANIENLTLTQTANINGTGNTLANIINGNDGNNILDGGLGTDSLAGGLGDDTYFIDLAISGIGALAAASLQDAVTEDLNKGIDSIKLRGAVSLINASTITLGDNIENLDAGLTGATKLNLTGNSLDNKLTGNAAGNIIDAGDGNDTLDGGAGLDSLIGGNGDDTYIVDSLAEANLVSDFAGNNTLVIGLTYTLANGGSFTHLNLAGAASINGTGNSLNNTLTGNAAANNLVGLDGDDTINAGAGADTLNGGLGADSMTGGDGNDVYFVDSSLDQVIETNSVAAIGGIDVVQSNITFDLSAAGANVENLTLIGLDAINAAGNALNNTIIGNASNNVLVGNAGNDTLTGNAGNDYLDGGLGNDSMNGGVGDDTYVVDAISDIVTENIAKLALNAVGIDGGADTIQASIAYALGLNIDNLLLTGFANLYGTGNALDNYLTGNDGNNVLSGLAGNDILDGAVGNDSLQGGLGNDTLYGGTGDDTLDGGAGIDSLIGGDGNDTYRLDLFAITSGLITTIGFEDLPEPDLSGNDTVEFRGIISNTSYRDFYIAGSTVENFDFTATGTTKINIIGDEYANKFIGNLANNLIQSGLGNDTIYGGAGNDTLDGGVDDDQMIGGDGNDTFVVDSINDQVIETNINAISGGTDLVLSSIDYTLGANLENLNLTNLATIGFGNALNNIIVGNDQNNVLNGSTGNDTLVGGLGDDSLAGGDGNDVLTGGLGSDMLTGGLGADRFVFNSIADSNPSLAEVITDFSHIQLDKIDLSAIDANSSTAINDAFTFATSFTGAIGQIVYDANTFSILADTNGDSAADFFINIWGVSTLVASDFVLQLF